MKKRLIALSLAALLLSGCSGVSQDEYNSLLEEKTKLETEISSLKSDNSKLERENSKATSDNSELQDKIKDLEKQNSENQALIEELQENNVPLEVVDVLVKTFAHNENELYKSQIMENLQMYIYTDMSVCYIYDLLSYLPAASIATILKEQEKTFNDAISIGASSYAFLFKSYNKKNIGCFWAVGEETGWVWFDKDVGTEYNKL